MDKIHFYEETYEEFLMNTTILGAGTESTVLAYGDFVLKILFPEFIHRHSRKKLAELANEKNLKNYMTLPLKEVYLDYHFIGYMMEYAGLSWKDYLISKNVSKEDLIRMLKKGKEALMMLHKFNIVHGDIQFSNIMINCDSVKISDINNVKYNNYKDTYFNEISLRLVKKYGTSYLLDLHAFNYMTYILLNADYELLQEYLILGADSINYFLKDEIKNTFFDDKVNEMQMELLLNPKNKKYALENSKYLIDYLK